MGDERRTNVSVPKRPLAAGEMDMRILVSASAHHCLTGAKKVAQHSAPPCMERQKETCPRA